MTIEEKFRAVEIFLDAPLPIIAKYIPPAPLITPTRTLKILLHIHQKPKLAKTHIYKVVNTHDNRVDNTINYLVSLGYIRPVKKSRWVSQINSFVVEQVFVITTAGKQALYDIWNEIDPDLSN